MEHSIIVLRYTNHYYDWSSQSLLYTVILHKGSLYNILIEMF